MSKEEITDQDELISKAELEETAQSIRTTVRSPADPSVTTTRMTTLKLIEDHFVNFDLLMKHYASDILSWADLKNNQIRKLLVQKGNRLNPSEFKSKICGQTNILIIITTTAGDIFGVFESRKIPQIPRSDVVYSKGKKGTHFVFSLSNPKEMAFKAQRKKRKGILHDKPFVGVFSNAAREDMFLSVKNFLLVSNSGGGMLLEGTYSEMYEFDGLGELDDYMEQKLFNVSCVGVYQIK